MSVDPTSFGPEAQQTQWTPLVPGGANFVTHELVDHPDGLELKKNLKLFAFGAVFGLVGAGVTVGGALSETWWMALFGLPFLAAGVWVMWPASILFDRRAGVVRLKQREVRFTDVVGLQLLSELVSSDSDFMSHELNLVLRDGTRLNLVDHAGRKVLRAEAERLHLLLGCPVWDATTK